MSSISYFKPIAYAMAQIFFLGLIGFLLVRRKILSEEGLEGLTDFFICVSFPALIFWQIITKFSFSQYPNWWIFPCLSLGITGLGLFVGYIFSLPLKDAQVRKECICLVGFQNAGYLPLVLLNRIVPQEQLAAMLIYLFLFLLGFNLVIWSWGVYFLSAHTLRSFSFKSLLSPPVVSILAAFILVWLNINKFIPALILYPLESLGNCSFPLAIVVIGASLAELHGLKKEKQALAITPESILMVLLAKLVVLPLIGLALVGYFRIPRLLGFLIVLELAVPSATNLAIISRRYAQKDIIISRGIFLSHMVSLITLPVFLALFSKGF